MSKRILLCDDSAFIRMMMKDILNRNGYEVCGEAAAMRSLNPTLSFWTR